GPRPRVFHPRKRRLRALTFLRPFPRLDSRNRGDLMGWLVLSHAWYESPLGWKFCPIIAHAKERTIGFRRIYPSAMLWRPSDLPRGYIRCRKGARTQGLLATLPAR